MTTTTIARKPVLPAHDRELDRDTAIIDISNAIAALAARLSDLAGSESAGVERAAHVALQQTAALVDRAAQGLAPVTDEAHPPHISEIRQATYTQELEAAVLQMAEDNGKLRKAVELAEETIDAGALARLEELTPSDEWVDYPKELGL